MNDKCFYYIMNLYFIFTIYIYIYIYILIFSFLVFLIFFKIMINAYLSKQFNFIRAYDGLFSNFSYYKCLYSNTSKHLKITLFKIFI